MGRSIKARCPANSVIVGRKGTLNKPLLIEEPFWNIDTCFGVIPSTTILPKYLFAFCQSFDFYSLIPASGRPSTTSYAVRGIQIPLPPLAVQREIVARLERELGAVDKLAKKFEELEAAAEAEFKAELKETFEGGGFEVVKLADYCSFTGGSQPPKSTFVYEPQEGYVRLFQIRDYNGDPKPTYIRVADAKKVSRRGDIMIGRYGASIGLVFWAEDGAYNVAMVKVIIKSSMILPEYVFYALTSPRVQRIFQSASRNAQAGFNDGEWAKMEVPLPTVECQREVVARLDAAKGKKEKLVAAARRGRETAALMRKAILKEAFE